MESPSRFIFLSGEKSGGKLTTAGMFPALRVAQQQQGKNRETTGQQGIREQGAYREEQGTTENFLQPSVSLQQDQEVGIPTGNDQGICSRILVLGESQSKEHILERDGFSERESLMILGALGTGPGADFFHREKIAGLATDTAGSARCAGEYRI